MISAETTVKRLQAELDGRKWLVEQLREYCFRMIGGEPKTEVGQESFRPDAAQSEVYGQMIVRLNTILKGWK